MAGKFVAYYKGEKRELDDAAAYTLLKIGPDGASWSITPPPFPDTVTAYYKGPAKPTAAAAKPAVAPVPAATPATTPIVMHRIDYDAAKAGPEGEQWTLEPPKEAAKPVVEHPAAATLSPPLQPHAVPSPSPAPAKA